MHEWLRLGATGILYSTRQPFSRILQRFCMLAALRVDIFASLSANNGLSTTETAMSWSGNRWYCYIYRHCFLVTVCECMWIKFSHHLGGWLRWWPTSSTYIYFSYQKTKLLVWCNLCRVVPGGGDTSCSSLMVILSGKVDCRASWVQGMHYLSVTVWPWQSTQLLCNSISLSGKWGQEQCLPHSLVRRSKQGSSGKAVGRGPDILEAYSRFLFHSIIFVFIRNKYSQVTTQIKLLSRLVEERQFE